MPATHQKVLPPPDRVKPFAQRSVFMVSVPVQFGLLCLENDCQVVYDERGGACPKCGSKASIAVRNYLDRRSAA